MIITHFPIDSRNIRFKVVPSSITKFLTTGDNMKWRGKKEKKEKPPKKDLDLMDSLCSDAS